MTKMDLWQCICPGVLAYVVLNMLTLSTDGMNSTEGMFKHTERVYAINSSQTYSINNETEAEHLLPSTSTSAEQNKNTLAVAGSTFPPSVGFTSTHLMSISPADSIVKRSKSNGTIIEAESKTGRSISFLNTESSTPMNSVVSQTSQISKTTTLLIHAVNQSHIIDVNKGNESDAELHSHHKNATADGSVSNCKHNCTKTHNGRKSRHRKHMHSHRARGYKQKFYNYKMLYNSIKDEGENRKKETEFYAWIFGATMLTLGSITTMTSCFIFCYCGDRWRQRRTYRYDKDCSYQRVDSVSSVVDSLDHVTII